jgi:hypothetical protein
VSRVTHRGCCHECLRERSLCRACECDYLVLVVVPVLDGVNHTLHCPAGGDTRPRSASIAPQQAQDGCRVLKVSASLKDYITALPQRAWRHPEAQLTATPRVPCSKLWVPASQRSVDFSSRQNPENMVYAGQGPPPPNPLVVERFQQVVSALFQQASVWKGGATAVASRRRQRAAHQLQRPAGRLSSGGMQRAPRLPGRTAPPPARRVGQPALPRLDPRSA